jgi:putative ABC transport system permease protein
MEIHRVLDADMQAVKFPAAGLVLSDVLAKVLGIRPGELVSFESLEGRRATFEVKVVGIVEQWIGMSAYMDLDALNRLLGEGDVISGVFLAVEPEDQPLLLEMLEERPRVAGTRSQSGTIQSWHETFEEVMLTFVAFIAAMAGAITLGVVYNAARITLSERSRELASLRVLGFTRAEISKILLGELSFLVLLAIPVGFLIGTWLSYAWAAQAPAELFKIPVVISPATFALSATVVLAAAVLSALIVRQRLNHLDLISALKTKE